MVCATCRTSLHAVETYCQTAFQKMLEQHDNVDDTFLYRLRDPSRIIARDGGRKLSRWRRWWNSYYWARRHQRLPYRYLLSAIVHTYLYKITTNHASGTKLHCNTAKYSDSQKDRGVLVIWDELLVGGIFFLETSVEVRAVVHCRGSTEPSAAGEQEKSSISLGYFVSEDRLQEIFLLNDGRVLGCSNNGRVHIWHAATTATATMGERGWRDRTTLLVNRNEEEGDVLWPSCRAWCLLPNQEEVLCIVDDQLNPRMTIFSLRVLNLKDGSVREIFSNKDYYKDGFRRVSSFQLLLVPGDKGGESHLLVRVLGWMWVRQQLWQGAIYSYNLVSGQECDVLYGNFGRMMQSPSKPNTTINAVKCDLDRVLDRISTMEVSREGRLVEQSLIDVEQISGNPELVAVSQSSRELFFRDSPNQRIVVFSLSSGERVRTLNIQSKDDAQCTVFQEKDELLVEDEYNAVKVYCMSVSLL